MTKQRVGMYQNYVVSRLNLKQKPPLNGIVSSKILKSKNKTSHNKKLRSHKLKSHESQTNHPSGTGGEGSNCGEPRPKPLLLCFTCEPRPKLELSNESPHVNLHRMKWQNMIWIVQTENTLFLGVLQQSWGSTKINLVWLAHFSFDSKVGPNQAPTLTYSLSSIPLIQIGTFNYLWNKLDQACYVIVIVIIYTYGQFRIRLFC